MKKIQMKSNEKLTLKEGLEYYLRKCAVRNLSDKTIKTYQAHYEIFEKYIGGDRLLETISEEDIDNFIVYLKEDRECKDITVNSYLRSIRALLYCQMERGYMKPFDVKLTKTTKEIKHTYTDEELKILLKKPDLKKCDFSEYKMYVFSNYLIATGNRLSTALNVLIRDLDFENGMIQMNTTKNRKQQIIPMSKTLECILREYLNYRGGSDEDYLFCTNTGEKAKSRTYQDALAKYNHGRGVLKTSAHLYRHTFAKKWILNGGDIFRLQKILGHSDLTIVREYVEMFSNDLTIDFDKFNPLETLTIKSERRIVMEGSRQYERRNL